MLHQKNPVTQTSCERKKLPHRYIEKKIQNTKYNNKQKKPLHRYHRQQLIVHKLHRMHLACETREVSSVHMHVVNMNLTHLITSVSVYVRNEILPKHSDRGNKTNLPFRALKCAFPRNNKLKVLNLETKSELFVRLNIFYRYFWSEKNK